MSDEKLFTRRTALKIGVCGVSAITAAGCNCESKKETACGCESEPAGVQALKTEDFYTHGAFDPKKALDAYFAMMERFAYPIPDVLRTDQLWACDFMQADFTKLGMAGIFWINELGTYGENGSALYKGDHKEEKFGYLGHEIYLLPGQALPEHSHVGGPEGLGPKMESWQVRYGEVDFFAEVKGDGSETLISDMPENERPWGYGEDWFKSKFVTKRSAQSGKLYSLEDPETWHSQRAGAQGAIVTEYATYHNHVQFSKPEMAFDNTKAEA
jgi:hypothetical protein